jgi:predicted aldo/keto reductase-like oxidoreductase
MSDRGVSRREFVEGLSLAAGATAFAGGAAFADEPAPENAAPKLLPKRKLGKNGPMVSMLALGGDMQTANALSLINRAWSLGYRYFDTAEKYGGHKEESIYRQWFARFPERRKELFLVSKDYPKKGPEQMLEMVDKRLEALGVDYLDLFFIHQLCPEVYGKESVEWPKSDRFRKVAEKLKDSGKCKMVGFSCHGGPEYIQAAADGGFLDALMVFYTPFCERGGAFDKAITACHEKGIGLIAMKTMRHAGNVRTRVPAFDKLGLTTQQVLLQSVWSDPRISAICNSVGNFDVMRSSVSAAHAYHEPLSIATIEELKQVVFAAQRTMCPGCPSCDAKAGETALAFRDIARYTTYYEQDGNHQARELYRNLTAEARDASQVDLVALRDACQFGIDYPEILRKAERYFA